MNNSALARQRRLFAPILAGASFKDRLLACMGSALGVSLTALAGSLGIHTGNGILLAAPIAASAVLLFAVPASPMAQPWPVIGGNTLSACVGVLVAQHGLPLPLASGLAVGLAILAMSVCRCLHPPGGAMALSVVVGGSAVIELGFQFPLAPVALNSIALVAVGWVYHRYSGHSYPHRAVPVAGHVIAPVRPSFHSGDLERALEDLGETFDVAREDLELLFERMEYHAERRLLTGPSD